MKVIYTNEEITSYDNSIFLAGPTPRDKNISSWRDDALKYLEELNFSGTVIVPEYRKQSYISEEGNVNDMSWDHHALENVSKILMWIPRDSNMPAFTSNIEFGYFIKSGRLYYGRPKNAIYMEYLDFLYAKELNKTPKEDLKDLIIEIIND